MVMDSLYSIRDNCDISIMLGRWYILWTSEDINLEILWVLFKGKNLQIWFFLSRGNQCKHFCTKKRLLLLFSYIRYNLFFLLFREKKVWRMLVTTAVLTREERILRIYFSILTSLQILSWQGVKRLFFFCLWLLFLAWFLEGVLYLYGPFSQLHQEIVADQELVKKVSLYLKDTVLPKFIQDLCTLEVSPMDGQTLTEALHAHGINLRYLGKVMISWQAPLILILLRFSTKYKKIL